MRALTFSARAKSELCRLPQPQPLQCALLAGIALGSLHETDKGLVLSLTGARAARLAYRLLRSLDASPLLQRGRGGGRFRLYLSAEDAGRLGIVRMAQRMPATRAGRRVYLAGAFLTMGSISAGKSGYHLEIAAPSAAAPAVERVLAALDLHAHRHQRKGHVVLYFKGGDAIAAFLGTVGASEAMLALEASRVQRDMHGQVNRLINAETANVERTVTAGLRQAQRLRKLKVSGLLDTVAPHLQETAHLRLMHPEATLSELAAELRVSRSAVNHRLRRLERLAQGEGMKAGACPGMLK